ncbi:MAG: VirB8/TrbF family protein [Brevundimonas sp.]|uniref:virB8 family protein n=1 Tax=Brevundimonas sp. TaxID=1871086 RepID=UPI00248A0A72|nr:VirB8/TrbF family protein [Brevundimonas sp.]MDI1325562.1 VirB8/TrbF family protein [Brevundimonas sp.]
MKKTSREALNAYYREAGSWATDQIEALRKSRRIAWSVAAAAVVVAVSEAIALVVLMPLKTVVPYTLMVDRTTGFVQALKPLDPGQITPDRALVQSMLVQYVIARESFDIATLQTNYEKVGLWSAERARSDYLTFMQASNIDGPLNLYPRSSIVEARVKSVSRLDAQSALVRFETVRRDEGGQYQPAMPWVGIVRYRFSGEPMSAEDRFLNPLGFQVLDYRRDPEALPAPEMSVSPDPYGAVPLEAETVQVGPATGDTP